MNWKSEVFWTAVSAVAAIAALFVPLIVLVGRGVKRHLSREMTPLRVENARLRDELETRLRLPAFSLDAVRLTELAAERRIEGLQAEHARAVAERDQQLAARRAEQLAEFNAYEASFSEPLMHGRAWRRI